MKVFRRLYASFFEEGFGATCFKLRVLAADYLFDLKYRTDTCAWSDLDTLTILGDNKQKGYPYRPTRVLPLRRLFRELRPMFPRDSVLVDIGSGKGRILMIASEFGFRKVKGLEFAHELCEVARKNIVHYKARTKTNTQFEIMEIDATHHEVSADENVFILYNPFDDTILSRILENISESVSGWPRKILIIYCNPRWSSVFEQRGNYFKVREFDFWSFPFVVYSNHNFA